MQSSAGPLLRLTLCAVCLLLAACGDRSVNSQRMQRYQQPALAPIEVRPSSLAVTLQVAANGRGFTPESLRQLNVMLKDQGRLSKQTLTLIPRSVRGEQMAGRLAGVLKNAGADARKVKQMRISSAAGQSGDLEVISEALAVKTTRCQVNDPDLLMVKPFEGMGYLGCATQNNLALMVAEPRDLIQAKTLDDADGVAAVNSIERYHANDVTDLIDIDFDED
ncbi:MULTISPECIES: CpaD family pilus assembly lipoprotein [Brenneria]|uniref:Pilus assembly protein PilZ n=1 Tax=Brenneria nigrifluens DSM 30175 = ATCC 13028 TaxID=1121120 RepID=A0A2U1URW1_9GAMM|nr:pilus (Caulobacter type) biogenesis lipoprotein CpaD [Brenneria sp. EniD312]PWC24410.1 pilus assembly protein PilZ [Brenneria nigrifluens DSM 30175 = ATCC 13028]QCR07019.1 pilus assembly protein PilZ [Brenneria nigrifluens DSM 30175 = ATCC 13028]